MPPRSSILSGSAEAQTSAATPADAAKSFGALKQIDAGLLNVGYAEAGPADGPVVILLHGWPYDIHAFVDVAPMLAQAGHRVIVPYVRGYGTTRFLATDAFRNGQPSALAVDLIALMDALKIEKAVLAGFDWGARTADIVAALWPERCKALVSVSGYLIGSQQAGKMPLPPKAELQWWYQFYFATERGRAGYEANRHDFNKLIWQLASPQWKFDDATFDRSAASFDNPDHVGIVVHNYRWRLGLAEGESRYDDLEKQLAAGPVIAVPTITMEGDANGAPHPPPGAYAKKFSGRYAHRTISWRHRPQPAAGSPAGLCPGRDRRRGSLIAGLVSRTRCGILHAAPQSRDPTIRKPVTIWVPAQRRTASRCVASGTRDLSAKRLCSGPDFLPARALSAPPSSPRTPPDQRTKEPSAVAPGEVAEWSNAPHSKCGIGASLSGVRIPSLSATRLRLRFGAAGRDGAQAKAGACHSCDGQRPRHWFDHVGLN